MLAYAVSVASLRDAVIVTLLDISSQLEKRRESRNKRNEKRTETLFIETKHAHYKCLLIPDDDWVEMSIVGSIL